jgi:hypothetical protein
MGKNLYFPVLNSSAMPTKKPVRAHAIVFAIPISHIGIRDEQSIGPGAVYAQELHPAHTVVTTDDAEEI